MILDATLTELDANARGQWRGPLVVRAQGSIPLAEWAARCREWIGATLLEQGAILLRGWTVESPREFHDVAAVLCGPLLDYVYRSTPRHAVDDRVYTATEYPADRAIPLHSENAYQRDWPLRMALVCLEPAAGGGETPLAKVGHVTARIDGRTRDAFRRAGVMYVRNYGGGVDLPWQTTFQTESRSDVERACREMGIECEWGADDGLRTRQVCQGLARHPQTDEELWFNQAHLFHVSALGPDTRRSMLRVFGEPGLPRHAYLGDGTRIEERWLGQIRRAFDAEMVTFSWQRGDVLLLDNMQVAHGRMPYTGTRRVLAAMGTAVSSLAGVPLAGAASSISD
jgi:alpha-ketoglutarate-dependent taurine dioxygenase